jgi:hypothetical protein
MVKIFTYLNIKTLPKYKYTLFDLVFALLVMVHLHVACLAHFRWLRHVYFCCDVDNLGAVIPGRDCMWLYTFHACAEREIVYKLCFFM